MTGGAIPSLISQKTLCPVYAYQIGGFGPFHDILIQLLAKPEMFLKNKKVLVYVVGTIYMNEANRRNEMFDIAKADHDRLLLNNRKKIASIRLEQIMDISIEDNEDALKIWNKLEDKTSFKIDVKGEIQLAKKQLRDISNCDSSKKTLLVIPCVCYTKMTCDIVVNDSKCTIPSLYASPNYRNIMFEIPAGTDKITISVHGKEGTIFAIKDIQIWQ